MSFKGAKKGKQKDSSKAASSTGDQSNASPGAYEATAPDWDEWHEDNCYAGQGRSYALYNEQQSYSHATFASNQKNKSNHREEAQVRIPGKIPCLTPTRVSIPWYLSQQVRKQSVDFKLPQQYSNAAYCALCSYRTYQS